MSRLVLLVSYPKSGNTWMRAFLASLTRGGRTPDINTELTAGVLTDRAECDAWVGAETSDLTAQEIAAIRPYISRRAAVAGRDIVKVHDANIAPPGASEPAFPADCVDRVIYIVRDPRDVAVSCTYHFEKSAEVVASDMNDPFFSIGHADTRLTPQIDQYLSTWSRHVESWLDAPDLRVQKVRYEDMANAPQQTFAAAARFLGVECTDDVLAQVVDSVGFQKLAEQEGKTIFRERNPRTTERFFRRGRIGGWRTELPHAVSDRIKRDHGRVMRRLGYVD